MATNEELKKKVETTAAAGEQSTLAQSTAYTPSATVQQAQQQLQTQLAQKPASYQSPWQTQLNDVMDRILNREKFSYDMNGDALLQQYKDSYTRQGKMAMMDTMGQAAALTGGYGNSYAQQAGQQAYQGYLQQVNDKIPELYQLALDMYNREGDALYDQASLLGAQEEMAYGRYRDEVGDWEAGLDRAQNQYYTERDFDYGKFSDDRAYEYQQGRDAVADAQWQAEFDEAVRQYEESKAKSSGGSSGGGGGSNPYKNLSEAQISTLLQNAGSKDEAIAIANQIGEEWAFELIDKYWPDPVKQDKSKKGKGALGSPIMYTKD